MALMDQPREITPVKFFSGLESPLQVDSDFRPHVQKIATVNPDGTPTRAASTVVLEQMDGTDAETEALAETEQHEPPAAPVTAPVATDTAVDILDRTASTGGDLATPMTKGGASGTSAPD